MQNHSELPRNESSELFPRNVRPAGTQVSALLSLGKWFEASFVQRTKHSARWTPWASARMIKQRDPVHRSSLASAMQQISVYIHIYIYIYIIDKVKTKKTTRCIYIYIHA